MSGTPVVVVWPNSDGTITLSQRKPTGHALPPVDPNPPRVATVEQSASDVRGSPFYCDETTSYRFASYDPGHGFQAKDRVHSAR
jgi:hypothetical protein